MPSIPFGHLWPGAARAVAVALCAAGVAGMGGMARAAAQGADSGAAAPRPAADALRLAPAWDAGRFQPRDATLEFALSRPLAPSDGRLAVVVGPADLSLLLDVRDTRVAVPLAGQALPSGELQVVAYLVTA